METTLASPQGAHRRSSAILPIFAIGRIAEVQSDEKSIFRLKRTAHFRQRIITSNLRDRYIGCAQCPGNDRRCIFDPQCLAKPLSISLGHHLFNSSKGKTVDPQFVASRSDGDDLTVAQVILERT